MCSIGARGVRCWDVSNFFSSPFSVTGTILTKSLYLNILQWLFFLRKLTCLPKFNLLWLPFYKKKKKLFIFSAEYFYLLMWKVADSNYWSRGRVLERAEREASLQLLECQLLNFGLSCNTVFCIQHFHYLNRVLNSNIAVITIGENNSGFKYFDLGWGGCVLYKIHLN